MATVGLHPQRSQQPFTSNNYSPQYAPQPAASSMSPPPTMPPAPQSAPTAHTTPAPMYAPYPQPLHGHPQSGIMPQTTAYQFGVHPTAAMGMVGAPMMGMHAQRAAPHPFHPMPGTFEQGGSPSKKLRGNKRWLSPGQMAASTTGSDSTATKAFRWLEDSRLFNARFVRRNSKELFFWLLLVALLLVVYKFFSDGSFSAVLTLASIFQFFSLAVLFLKVRIQVSVAGVSLRSLGLYALTLVLRLSSTLFFNGYLPVDKSGDWIYQAADVFSLFIVGLLFLSAHTTCAPSLKMQQHRDNCHVAIPVLVAGVLAVFIHPSLNQWTPADIAWTLALYVETFAMVPQLYMMSNIGGEVEVLTSHYVASMAVSKFFAFIFWFFSYSELAPREGGVNIAGYAVLGAFGLQLLLFADFLYQYINSIRIGRSLIIARV